MTTRYETYKMESDYLDALKAIKVVYGQTTYRDSIYTVPEKVNILDRGVLDKETEWLGARLSEAEKSVQNGVFGAKTDRQNIIWRMEFVEKVRNGDYPTFLDETSVAEPAPAPERPAQPQDAMGILASVVAEVVARSAGEDVVKEVSEKAIGAVKAFIAEEYGTIVRKVVLETPEGPKPVEGTLHAQFEEVLAYVQADEPVYLVGPAGCGKNVLCKQVAEARGQTFFFTNAVTQEYKLTGFTDAMGIYQESQFYKAFTQGGLFFLDEMDASIPETMLILNAAIANRYFDFPAPIGRVEAHPEFRVIAAGNTVGQGASFEYVGRSQLDASTLDRFAVVEVGYDEKVELQVAGGDEDLVGFIHEVRRICEKKGISLIASYRGIGRIAKMSQTLPLDKVLRQCLFKGLTETDLKAIESEMPPKFRDYTQALSIITRL